MRVAFFGGSFDPPHMGHLRIAEAAADRMRLDRVLLAPVGVQPLKQGAGATQTAFADRLAMVRLMLEEAGDVRLAVSEMDAPRADGRPNYTFVTLKALRAQLEAGDELFLLTGADSLTTLPQWHRALELVCGMDVIVATRPGFALELLYSSLLRLAAGSELAPAEQTIEGVEERVLAVGRAIDKGEPALSVEPEPAGAGPAGAVAKFYFLKDLREDVSATAIRSLLAEGGAPEGLAPRVLGYIRERGLYG